MVSFFAPGFEKFIVDATREAIPMITDPAAAEEAPAVSAAVGGPALGRAPRAYPAPLSRRWPGLQQVADDVVAFYERLTATRSLRWRLAYWPCSKQRSRPTSKCSWTTTTRCSSPATIGWRRCSSGISRRRSEHRSSALLVYNAVADDYLFRLRTIPAVVRHLRDPHDHRHRVPRACAGRRG